MATRDRNNRATFARRDGASSKRRGGRRFLLIGSVIIGGLLVSTLIFFAFCRHEKQLAKAQFSLLAEKKAEAVKHSLSIQLSTFSLIKSFYAGSQNVDRNEFTTFASTILRDSPDFQLLAWVPRVPEAVRQLHERTGKKIVSVQYEITQFQTGEIVPAAKRAQYFPIFYIESREEHQGILGLDLGDLPGCLPLMNRAQAQQKPIITHSQIPGLNGKKSSTVIYIYEYAKTEPAPSQNTSTFSRQTDGFILGMVDLRITVKKALELLQPSRVDLYLFDITDRSKPLLMLSCASRLRNTPSPVLRKPPKSSDANHFLMEFSDGDRRWLVCCVSAYDKFAGSLTWQPLLCLFLGLIITGLIAGYLFLVSGRTAQIERLAAQRTNELVESEQRFRSLVENAPDAFYVHRGDGVFIDVNQRACEQTGYTREELLSMNVFDLEVGRYSLEDLKILWTRPASDFPLDVEGVHRRKDGSSFPVDVRLSCVQLGERRMFLALVRDVTERRRAEDALRRGQNYLRHLIDLQERDRKLISYEIHDGLTQHLTAASFKLQVLEERLKNKNAQDAMTMLEDVFVLIGKSIKEARHLIGGLRPPILDEMGVIAAIEYLISERRQSGGPEIEFFSHVDFQRLEAPLEAALFRIAQECLTNACRHSQSSKILVELRQVGSMVRLTVEDWGVGFDPGSVKSESYGLRGIRERASLLGGKAEVNSSVGGKGTKIAVQLPLLEAEDE
ncbi:MAG: sensor histidine kinase [Thermoguttaceae bacterium]